MRELKVFAAQLSMCGDERIQDEMFSCVTLEQRVP